MSVIDVDEPVVTLINVFTVPTEHQQELVDRLVRATDEAMRHLPGFISANIITGASTARMWPTARSGGAKPTSQRCCRTASG